MSGVYKIDGVQIKAPSTFKIERFNLTKSGRVASGKMTMELVAKKRKFYLTYEVISGPMKKQILDLIDSDKMFFTFEYPEDGEQKTATVYAGAIPSERFRTDGVWYWKGFRFDLIEQ